MEQNKKATTGYEEQMNLQFEKKFQPWKRNYVPLRTLKERDTIHAQVLGLESYICINSCLKD